MKERKFVLLRIIETKLRLLGALSCLVYKSTHFSDFFFGTGSRAATIAF